MLTGSGVVSKPDGFVTVPIENKNTQPALPSAGSSATSGPGTGSQRSFGNMTHNWEAVTKQADIGIWTAKRVGTVFKKLCVLEEEYAKGIAKLVQHEASKAPRLQADHMKGFKQAWETTQTTLMQLSAHHSQQAAKVMYEVVVPLIEFQSSAEDRKRQLMAEERKYSAEMATARNAANNNLDQCQKLLFQAKSSREQRKQAASAPASSSKPSSLLAKLSSKVTLMTTQAPDVLQGKACSAAQTYQASVAAANACQRSYLGTHLPRIFGDMEQLERTRLEHLKTTFQKHAAIRKEFVKPLESISSHFASGTASMDPGTDIAGCINDWLREHGEPEPERPFVYVLPCSPDEIKAGRFEGNPNSVFCSTLAHCMTLQTSSPGVDVPRIVPALIQAIKANEGYQSEGIFRLSVSKQELDSLYAQVDRGDYDFKSVNPHVPANLLKLWLRLLAEPLIPELLYPQAIAAAKDKQCPPSVVAGIYKQLDPLNRRVLDQIAAMAREISTPENSATNRMNIDNLAIVFSPCFMRNPSQDPIEILQNAKFETRFTVLLFNGQF